MEALVETRDLKTYFPILRGFLRRPVASVKAVDNVNLSISKGQWMGLVGESGCGKTTLGKTILRFHRATSGRIFFDVPGDIKNEIKELDEEGLNSARLDSLISKYDLTQYKGNSLKPFRKRMQLVHQDPYTSLNPRMRIGATIGEPIAVHKLMSRADTKNRVVELLRMVGLAEDHYRRYPHQFSGGQRQRIAIARALATDPEFIIFDEPTSALDVSVQAQILDLLKELLDERELTYLYITHDLTVAESVCNTIAVMYLGKIVEIGRAEEIFNSPMHPYTQALVLSTPVPDPKRKRDRVALKGEVPSPVNPPSACRFHPRCTRATEQCGNEEPILESDKNDHLVACWHPVN